VALPSPSVARWTALDPPARQLLAALYREDQAREDAEYADRRDNLSPGRPAATWRWIGLDPAALTDQPDPVPAAKHLAELLNATPNGQLEQLLGALAERRLVDHRAGPGASAVQLTRLGRQAVRAGLRERPGGRAPAHLLRGWAWQLLAELYHASDHGVHPAPYTGRVGSDALSALRYRPDGPLVEDVSVPQPVGQPARRLRITEAGRAFYERTWAEHDRWHPGVRATPPPGVQVVALPALANDQTT
jgi:hypothetical protein